jgi:hypothetical protein
MKRFANAILHVFQDRLGLVRLAFVAAVVALVFSGTSEASGGVRCRAALSDSVTELLVWAKESGTGERDSARLESEFLSALANDPDGSGAKLLRDYVAVRRGTYARPVDFGFVGEPFRGIEWNSLETFKRNPLRSGQVEAFAFFLRDTATDPAMRSYMSRLLGKMKRDLDARDVIVKNGVSRQVPDEHALVYDFARRGLEAELAALSVPTTLSSDLRVFAVQAVKVTSDGAVYTNPKLVEQFTSYDKLAGKLVLREKIDPHFDEGATSWTLRGSKSSVDRYIEAFFDWYAIRGMLPKQEIDVLRRKERSLPKRRTTYFVYTEAATGQMQSMIRLYDGNPMYQKLGESGRISRVGYEETFIERDFPFLILPERKTGVPIFELGRLGVDRDRVIDGVFPLLARVADWLEAEGKTGVIYLDALEGAAQLYVRRYGAEVAYSPEQLAKLRRLKTGDTTEPRHKLTILRFKVEDFIARFKDDYSVPKKRPGM